MGVAGRGVAEAGISVAGIAVAGEPHAARLMTNNRVRNK